MIASTPTAIDCSTRRRVAARTARRGSEVLLNFVDIPTMGSTDVLDRRRRPPRAGSRDLVPGRRSQAWLVRVGRARARSSTRRSPWPVAAILRLPEQMALCRSPSVPTAPLRSSIDTVTLRTHAPDSVATNERVITVERTGDEVVLGTPCADPMQALRVVMDVVYVTAMLRPISALDRPSTACSAALGRRLRPRLADHLPDAGPEVLFYFAQLVEETIPMLLLLKRFPGAPTSRAHACDSRPSCASTSAVEPVPGPAGCCPPTSAAVDRRARTGNPSRRELGVAVGTSTPRVAFWLDSDCVVPDSPASCRESHGERR